MFIRLISRLIFIVLLFINNPLSAELMIDGKLKGDFGPIDAITMNAKATPGSELLTWGAAAWDEDGVTWTFAASTLTHITGNTTAVTGTLTGALTAGVTYKVVLTGTGGGATATYTVGGVTGTTIAASGAIAIEDYITATADSELVITPANTCTVALTLVSVKALTGATGDVTIDGNLTVRSPAYFHGRIYGNPANSVLSLGRLTLSDGTNADGIVFGSLGTATKAIDLSGSGLSGGSDYWIYNDTTNYWAADGSIGMGPKIQLTGAAASNYNRLIFASASGTACQINSDEGNAQMMWAIGSLAGYQINIMDQSFHDGIDYDHAAQTNPTLFLHASINPNVSNNYWGNIAHDQSGFVISTGDETGVGTTPATIDNYIGFNTASNGLVKYRCWNKSVADDATLTLNAAGSGMTNGGFGVVFVGNNEERSFFFIDNDGDVTLVSNSANVVANADTDTKVCLGTAAAQEPLTVKNRLGATKIFNILVWYN